MSEKISLDSSDVDYQIYHLGLYFKQQNGTRNHIELNPNRIILPYQTQKYREKLFVLTSNF